jgi:hypothetical protein
MLALVGTLAYRQSAFPPPEPGPQGTTRGALMLDPIIAEKAKREGLKAKRKMLFEEYLQSPRNTRLALEIKLIDDDLAKSVEGAKIAGLKEDR